MNGRQRDVASFLIGQIETTDRLITSDADHHAEIVVRCLDKIIPGTMILEYVWNIQSWCSDPEDQQKLIRREYDVDSSGLVRSYYWEGASVRTGKVLISALDAYLKGYGYV